MKLKDKTHKKFVEFFTEMGRANQENEFELSYAEIQRSIGTASVTLKRALAVLVEEGLITMAPGRNSRYARFTVQAPLNAQEAISTQQPEAAVSCEPAAVETADLAAMERELDLMKRRVRSQEIAISLLQDRLADLEDKAAK